MTEPLFTVQMATGSTEQALSDQLDQWATAGHSLPVAVVAALRNMARACDAHQGKPTTIAAATANRDYLQALAEWGPGSMTVDESWQQVLDRASQPQV